MEPHSFTALWDALAEANGYEAPPGGLKTRLYRQLGRSLPGKKSRGHFYHTAACIAHLWGWQTFSGIFFRKALAAFSRLEDPNLLAACHRDYGLVLERQQYAGDARDHWEEAYRLYLGCGNREGMDSLENRLGEPEGNPPGLHNSSRPSSLQSVQGDVYHLQLEELHKVHLLLKPHEEPRELMDSILMALLHATNATQAALILERENSGSDVIAMDFRNHHLAETEISINWELVAKARAGKGMESLKGSSGSMGQSVICFPLLREKYWGCIYLVNKKASQLFNPSALKAVQILSTQTVLLLDYSLRMQEVRALNHGLSDKAARQAETILSKNKTLRQTRARLKRMQNLKSLLTETIVHDVKNYQAVITSNLRIAGQCSALSRAASENLYRSMDACSQINTLASNLIDLSKIDGNPHSLNKVYLNRETLAAVISEAETHVSRPVSWKFGEEMPSYFEIHWDAYYFKRMWAGLAEWLEVTLPKNQSAEITLELLSEPLKEYQPQPKELPLVFCRHVAEAHGGRLVSDENNHLILALDNRYGLKLRGSAVGNYA